MCPVPGCGRTFIQSNTLGTHSVTHTGLRAFACKFAGCGATYKLKGHLRNHENVHTNARPFKCTYDGCDKAFNSGSHLSDHRRLHTNERPHVCNEEGCGATFVQGSTLKQHVFYHHTKEGQQQRKREEERVAKHLTAVGVDFKREHQVDLGCVEGTFARTDFLILLQGKVIVVEVDENQHEGYGVACDISRMLRIYEAWIVEGNQLPVSIIRYNPHPFRVDGKEKRVTKKAREARLVEAIKEAGEGKADGLQIRYMYYDMDGGRPKIMEDPSFTIGDCCVEAIA